MQGITHNSVYMQDNFYFEKLMYVFTYFVFDRVADWTPILGALGINKTLEFIAIRSYYQNTIDEQGICSICRVSMF